MNRLFADACYWIALLNPRDQLHEKAVAVTATIGRRRIVTSDLVLGEVLTFCAERGEPLRKAAARQVRVILENPNIDVVPATRQQFLDAVSLYEGRPDKGYSHVDCASFEIMRERGIGEALTNDRHFAQEGFTILL